MNRESVLQALRTVQEPDLGKDIVSLDMVKDIELEGHYVSFTVVLTTPACPLKDLIKRDCVQAIQKLVDAQAVVNVKFSANTNSNRTDPETVLPKVRNIIACLLYTSPSPRD